MHACIWMVNPLDAIDLSIIILFLEEKKWKNVDWHHHDFLPRMCVHYVARGFHYCFHYMCATTAMGNRFFLIYMCTRFERESDNERRTRECGGWN